MTTVGLFIPCYIDQFCPDVGWATVELLEQYGCTVIYPRDQTCCGQPMANAGYRDDATLLAKRFIDIFSDPRFQYVVAPSGSCVAMVRHQFPLLLGQQCQHQVVSTKTYELCEFLVDVLQIRSIDTSFPYRVGLHQSCHGLRDLRLASASELVGPPFDKVRTLLTSIRDLQLVAPTRGDECCGFGGTFAIDEASVSCQMGNDRIDDHMQAGAEVITATDMSCLFHLRGLIQRRKLDIGVMHVAQILAGRSCGASER